MTIPPPTVAPVTVDLPADVFRAAPDLQPFTYRSGMTYTKLLESMRSWLYNTLVPYLNTQFEDVQGAWIDNVTAISTAVDAALAAQQAAVDQELATTLAQIVAGENAALNDATILAVLEAAGSTSLGYLDTHYDGRYDARYAPIATKATVDLIKTYFAPAPSGGDDTATLQALVTAAQTTNGEIVFEAGTYQANLVVANGAYPVPILRGRGELLTVIKSFNPAKPAIKLQGTPGAMSGGGVRDLGINGNGGIALQHANVSGTRSFGLHIFNAATAVDFFNELTNSWTEFCTVEASIDSAAQAVHYHKAAGNESFHGSGLVGNSVVNMASGADAAVLVDDGCFPYNAPMSASIFPAVAGTQTAIKNLNVSRGQCSFFGTLRTENLATIGATGAGTARIWFAGEVLSLAGAPTRLGNLYLVDKAYFGASGAIAQYKPYQRVVTLAGGSTNVLPEDAGYGMLVAVDITGPNYHYAYQLLIWRSPYNSTGVVTQLSHPFENNSSGVGAPTFTYNNGLLVGNSNYTSSHSAYVSVVPLNAPINYDRLAQY